MHAQITVLHLQMPEAYELVVDQLTRFAQVVMDVLFLSSAKREGLSMSGSTGHRVRCSAGYLRGQMRLCPIYFTGAEPE